MKTPQEWWDLFETGKFDINDGFGGIDMIAFIKEIQIDACLSATINAVAIANKFADYDESRDGRRIANEIRQDADIWFNTEKL